jgi:DNA-binding transcriptional regulator of glucitol operon
MSNWQKVQFNTDFIKTENKAARLVGQWPSNGSYKKQIMAVIVATIR